MRLRHRGGRLRGRLLRGSLGGRGSRLLFLRWLLRLRGRLRRLFAENRREEWFFLWLLQVNLLCRRDWLLGRRWLLRRLDGWRSDGRLLWRGYWRLLGLGCCLRHWLGGRLGLNSCLRNWLLWGCGLLHWRRLGLRCRLVCFDPWRRGRLLLLFGGRCLGLRSEVL